MNGRGEAIIPLGIVLKRYVNNVERNFLYPVHERKEEMEIFAVENVAVDGLVRIGQEKTPLSGKGKR